MTSVPRSGSNAPAATRPSLPPAWSPGSQSPTLPSSEPNQYGARSSATVTAAPATQAPGMGQPRSYDNGPGYEGAMGAPPSTPLRDDAAPAFTPRIARLTVASIDPFSVLKLSFLLSVAAGVALVVASVVLWMVLNAIGVFGQLNDLFGTIGGLDTGTDKFDIYDYVGLGRVLSISIVIGVIDTILLTALCTVSAFLYNLGSGLVGGIRVTLSDD